MKNCLNPVYDWVNMVIILIRTLNYQKINCVFSERSLSTITSSSKADFLIINVEIVNLKH